MSSNEFEPEVPPESSDRANSVGYKRPPKGTRWKPGQTGNPRRIRRKAKLTGEQLVDLSLAKEIKFGDRRMRVFEAFLIIIEGKARTGDRAAKQARRLYRRYARMMDNRPLKVEGRAVEFGDPRYGKTEYE